MKINKCYAVIDKDTGEYLRCSYKYPIPFYRTQKEAENALKGFKAHYRTNEKGYQIEEIILPKINRVVWEG
ncbi:MAG: hypothetical protein HFJ55_04320 [Clostridia bacterium]|jgi:hypothetical protein|nr:hypothetical protein [Clostridia bacterium]